MQRLFLLLVLLFTLLVAGACSRERVEDDPEVEPTPTEEATPTVAPSPTPEPTATPEPTVTPEPEATPESTATPEPTPTFEPEPESEPERSTLTGELIDEEPLRPIAIRIDNHPAARPQTGLVHADIVYESPTEAGLSRFLALFQTESPDVVGPARSARLMDLDLVPLHDALFAYSGASTGVQDRLWQRGLPLLQLEGNASEAAWRDNSRVAPHNLYASIPELREVAEETGWNREAENQPFTFDDLPDGGTGNVGVDIPYVAGTAQFRYNSDTDSYDRAVDGVDARDAQSDEIVSPRNVIVMWAPFFVGDVPPNTRGEISNDVDLYGSGEAWIFRNGERFDVEWQRSEQTEPFRFFHQESGEEISLAEGSIWVNLLPLDMDADAIE